MCRNNVVQIRVNAQGSFIQNKKMGIEKAD